MGIIQDSTLSAKSILLCSLLQGRNIAADTSREKLHADTDI